MVGVGGRGGLRKPHPLSSARNSENQGQGVEDSMVPRDPCYELARPRAQSLGDKENVALELWGKTDGSIGIQTQQGPKEGTPTGRRQRTEKAPGRRGAGT